MTATYYIISRSVSPVMQVVASSVTSVTASVILVTSMVSSVTSALLGTFLSKTDSEPHLEDTDSFTPLHPDVNQSMMGPYTGVQINILR